MQSTKEQILNLLYQAQQLVEQGEWTCDGLQSGDEELLDAMYEMAQAIEDASEKIGYYMD